LVTLPTTAPAPVIAVVAAACLCPPPFPTRRSSDLLLTTRLTAAPDVTLVPATGFWLITVPAGTVELDCIVTLPTTRPAPVIAVVAATCTRLTTSHAITEAAPLLTTRLTAAPDVTLV